MAKELKNVRKTQMGATYSRYALIVEEKDGALPTYSAAKELSEFVKLSESVQKAEAKFYSNDRLSESVESFKYCDLSYDNKGLSDEVQCEVLGMTQTEDGELVRGIDDAPPFIGFAFYRVLMDNGVTYYEGVFYPKVKASLGNDDYETRGENTNFKGDTTTLIAYAAKDEKKAWKRSKMFATEAEAKAWVDGKFGTAAA